MQEKLLPPAFFPCCKKCLVPSRIETGPHHQEAGIVTTKPCSYLIETHDISTVLESPGKPVTGSPPILKACHSSLIEGSPSMIVSPVG